MDALRSHRRAAARRSVATAVLVLLGSLGFLLVTDPRLGSGWVIFLALLAAWLAATVYEYRQASRVGPATFAASREEFRHSIWLQSRRSTYTELLLGLLVLVMLAESLGGIGQAIAAAGLDKAAVRDGETWRLLSGPLLHGGLLHLGMNALGLWSLGPLVEAHAGRPILPIVFLVSTLSGSVFSLILLPHALSVGASGSVLGLAGYLFLLGFRRRHTLPSEFIQRMGVGILATAVFGLVGYELVDNATHLGGLLGGMLLALLLPSGLRDSEAPAARRMKTFGRVSLGVLGAAALGGIVAIYLAVS